MASPHLVWIYTQSPTDTLDSATWLETTRELRNLGWCVTLVAVGPSHQRHIRDVDIVSFPRPNIYLLGQLAFHARCLALLLRNWNNVDVILFHQMSAPWLLPLRVLRPLTRRHRPFFVMDIRTLHMTPQAKQSAKDKLRKYYYRIVNQLVNYWADGQLAITHRMAEAVPVPHDKLWGIWPSGVNLERFAPAQESRQWPAPPEPIQLVYTGNLNYERNLLTLSRAVASANAEGTAFTLTLIGSGTQQAELETFAGHTHGWMRVLPPVPHDRIPEYLAKAHVGVLPFPDEEKFRVSSFIKLFEYMAAGLPMLATRITAHTDVVGDGEYVIWAEGGTSEQLQDALRQLWQVRMALPEMGRSAAKAAHAWTWHEAAKKLHQALIDGMAQGNSKHSSKVSQEAYH